MSDAKGLSTDQRQTLREMIGTGKIVIAMRSPIASSLLRKGLVTRIPVDLNDDRGRRQCELTLTEEGARVARMIGGKS